MSGKPRTSALECGRDDVGGENAVAALGQLLGENPDRAPRFECATVSRFREHSDTECVLPLLVPAGFEIPWVGLCGIHLGEVIRGEFTIAHTNTVSYGLSSRSIAWRGRMGASAG